MGEHSRQRALSTSRDVEQASKHHLILFCYLVQFQVIPKSVRLLLGFFCRLLHFSCLMLYLFDFPFLMLYQLQSPLMKQQILIHHELLWLKALFKLNDRLNSRLVERRDVLLLRYHRIMRNILAIHQLLRYRR